MEKEGLQDVDGGQLPVNFVSLSFFFFFFLYCLHFFTMSIHDLKYQKITTFVMEKGIYV